MRRFGLQWGEIAGFQAQSLTNPQRKSAHYRRRSRAQNERNLASQAAQNARATAWADASSLLLSLDGLRSVITIFGPDGRLLYANAHLNYLFRSFPPRHTLIGKSYEELIRLEIEGGEIAPAALAGGHAPFIAQRLIQLREKSFAPRDICLADRRIVEIKARSGEDGCTVLLWTDVTAARAQLARLQEAVSLSAEAFAFYDAKDRLILANDLYAQLCGVRDLDELMGKSFTEIAGMVAHGGRLVLNEPPEQWLERRLKGHRDPVGAVTIRTSSGEAYLVRDRASPDGGRVMVFTDVTDRVRAEIALKEQQSTLADAHAKAEQQKSYLADLATRLDQASAKVDSAKTTLLRTMGHELKTPLNAILGFSDLMGTMAERMSPAQIREYAGLVHQGGQNLHKIINQIMDLTKISAGRYQLHRGPVDAGGLMWQTREAVLSRANARGIQIDADRCPVGLLADADEAVLTGMIQSLLDNAVTFTTGRHIVLSVKRGGGNVTLTVEDDGAGVAPEDLARIQEPFEHAGRSDGADHAKGAGLGLTLVKAFAELHGGVLELDSRPGQGFSASITVPAVSA
jgi:two-component system, cell cycle sensor histidine kinase PleC